MVCDSECDFVKDPERSLAQLKLYIWDRMEGERKVNVLLRYDNSNIAYIDA